MKKYKYNINNLDCANCARKIEESLNKNADFKNVSVNFNTSKLIYESEKDMTLKELNALVKKVEPDAYLTSEEIPVKKEYNLTIFISALILGAATYFLNLPSVIKYILYIISYVLLLYRTSINAIKLLIKSHTINENALITISCFGALLLGEVLEGIMVIALYTIGKMLEEKAINTTRKSIKNLIDLKSPYALREEKNGIKKIDLENIKVGDILIIKKGEKIPTDGIIVKGETKLDTSALTGESEDFVAKENDSVLSGCLNLENVIEIKAISTFENSTVSKILDLLESATDKKTKTETTVSKISKIYTPIVMILAFIVGAFLPLLFDINYSESIYRALTFLVISCPCAIAISVPLSYFTAIGASSKSGILVKGSNYLESLSELDNIIFDKTGTLTNGTFTVTNIKIYDKNYSKEEIINILVKGESLSSHPIAQSIVKLTSKKISNKDVKDFKEIEGNGITFTIKKKEIKIGNKNLCHCLKDEGLHLSIDGNHVASIIISDDIKDGAYETIKALKDMNIKTYMFTGDKKEIALSISEKLNIDEVKYEMLPTDKFQEYEKVANNKITAFVGDGINDAPVLKRADIGISMGMNGSDSAIEASDIVLMKDDLTKLVQAINISKFTKKIIIQNLIFALSVKVIILILSILGFANMWFAVFADTGVTLLTILNALQILKKKY